jgi:hypothetical protein
VEVAPAPEVSADEAIPDAEAVPSLLERDPRARPLMLDPGDLTTATYESHPTVGIPQRELGESEVSELARRFDLVTWPEREVVRTTPRYLDEAAPNAAYSRIVLEPDAPLENRWYAIRARFDERDAPLPEVNPRDGDYVVSRFFYGSNPILQRVSARARPEGGGDILVIFSESVRLERNPFLVQLDGVESNCRLGNATTLASEAGATRVWLDCPSLAASSSVVVSTRAPVYSAAGEPVYAAGGGELDTLAFLEGVATARAEPSADAAFAEEPERIPDGTPVASTFVPAFGLESSR